ncbi:MAG TPA: hypothetical protein VM283_08645, partial [Armatimonadota bacterium]|nr:hypothetical protein [Armatimonadota bacterium]
MSTDTDERDDAVGPRGRLGRAWASSCALRGCSYCLLIFGLPLLGVWWLVDWSSQRSLAREMQRDRDLGLYVSLDEIPDQHAPDAENAYLVYEQALGKDAFTEYHSGASRLDPTGQWRQLLWAFLHPPDPAEQPPGQQPTSGAQPAADLAQVRLIMSDPRVVRALAALERGSLMPECVLPGRSRDRVQQCPARGAFSAADDWLYAQAKLCALDGKPDEALRWLTVIVRMSNQLGRDPSGAMWFTASRVRSGALRQTEEVLSAGAPSAAALRRLQGALAAADPEGEFKRFMRAQSAVVATEFDELLVSPERCFTSMGMSLSDLPSPALPFLRVRRYRAFRSMHSSEEALWLRWVREAYEASLTVPAAPIEGPRPAPQGSFSNDVPIIALTLHDALDFDGVVYARMPSRRDVALAELNVARAAIAVALYRAEHGEYP